MANVQGIFDRTVDAEAADQNDASAFDQPGHEQVVFCQDQESGLRAIIAIYSTALGPSLGGTRFYPYPSEEAALADALNLSRAMAYKNALAGLDHGGGKAVIIGDPARDKSEALLRAYGRFVQSLSGRYITACDIGTYSEDMDIIARECRYVTGRTVINGGAGDSSVLTALGVFQGMRAAAERAWGTPSLDGRVVGVEGVGKVGRRLADHLIADGARVVIYDTSAVAVSRVRDQHPEVTVAGSPAELLASRLDVFSPCALGGSVNDAAVAALGTRAGDAKIICGGANNQLDHPGIAKLLVDYGILYAPDYLVNAGGVIQVADELNGFSFERAKARAEQIYATTLQLFATAAAEGVPPGVAAGRLAERRMNAIGRLRGIYLSS
ncbi:MAG TPA: Glu/Leu/Phe/Val dehydrogenase dimerization domain-containing protein [Streptosporangiaceae bacterium]|nr:Glu/Leu/Phe/Val dehydrogenase dimerization domain-containing protein [Streptosporangiaceae bacterium]